MKYLKLFEGYNQFESEIAEICDDYGIDKRNLAPILQKKNERIPASIATPDAFIFEIFFY